MVDDTPAQSHLCGRGQMGSLLSDSQCDLLAWPLGGGLGLNPDLIEDPLTPQVCLVSTQRATTPSCGIISSSTLTSTLKTPTSWMGTQLTCRPSVLLLRRRFRLQAGLNSLLEVSMATKRGSVFRKELVEGRAGVCRSCVLTKSAIQAVRVCWTPAPGKRKGEVPLPQSGVGGKHFTQF